MKDEHVPVLTNVRAVFTWLSKGIGFGFGFGFTTPFGWLVYLLWFWFYDSQVKTALNNKGPVIGGSYCHDKFLLAGQIQFYHLRTSGKILWAKKILNKQAPNCKKSFQCTPRTLSLHFPLPAPLSN